MNRSFAMILGPALLLAPNVAFGAAYFFTDSGTRALGRGNAFVAGVNDLSAQYYNPAALTRLDRTQAYVSLSGVDQYIYFQRADDTTEGLTFDPIQNEGRYMAIPAFGVATKFGLPNTTFALGLYSPFAPDLQYPVDGAQRYTLIDQLVWKADFGPSVAHRITPWLSVGAGFSLTTVRIEQDLAISATLDESVPESPDNDIDVALRAWQKVIPNWNAAILVEPMPELSLGFTVVPPIKVSAPGSITTDFTGNWMESFLDGTVFTDEDIHMVFELPLILRSGVAWRPTEKAEIELDYVWEGWHVLDDVIVTDLDLVIEMDPDGLIPEDAVITNDIVLPANYQDAWSLRLGGDYDFTDHLTWRAGGYHETSGVPLATQGVSVVDGNKWAISTGATWHLQNFDFDFAIARSWIARRTIDDSEIRQLRLALDLADPGASQVVNNKVVGNGFFESYLNFASASVTWRFGAAPKGSL